MADNSRCRFMKNRPVLAQVETALAADLVRELVQTAPPYRSSVRAIPPSAEIVSPVTNRAASEARNTMTSAMSSGVAHLRSGVWCSIVSITPATVLLFAHRAVSTTPGATEFTLIPDGPSSMANDLVAASMAPFEAA